MSTGLASVNKVILIGNLGYDPEIKKTANEIPVLTVSIATSEMWKDSDGNKQTRTHWHRVVFWRKLAELAGQYLKKGSKIYIEGRLQTRSWMDDNDQKHFITEIIADNLVMLDKRQTDNESSIVSEPDTPDVSALDEQNFPKE